MQSSTLDPAELGFAPAQLEDLQGGDAFENARITRGILEGRLSGPPRDTVVLNAAAALVAAGKTSTLAEGIELARHSIDSGAALRTLDNLVDFSQHHGAEQPTTPPRGA